MTTQFFWNSLAVLVAWLIVWERLFSVLRRQPHLTPAARRQVWLFWTAFFGFAMAGTVYHPAVQKLLTVSGWFHDVPQTGLAIAAYVIGAHICYSFAPAFRPRWNWPLYVGAGVVSIYIFLSWTTRAWPIVSSLVASKSAIPRLIFDAFMLVVLGRIVLPAYGWAWRHEQQRPMRLRFRLIAGMHGFVAAWFLVEIGEAAAWIYGIVFNLTPVYVPLGVFITLLFAAHFVPPSFFVYLVQMLDYPRDILTYLYVRKVEIRSARLVNWRPIHFGWRDMLREPAKAVYRCVVAIFDMRKLLRQCDHVDAQDLSIRLDAVAQADLDYTEIVAQLRELGQTRGRNHTASRPPLGLTV
jgi:hypothetical protein